MKKLILFFLFLIPILTNSQVLFLNKGSVETDTNGIILYGNATQFEDLRIDGLTFGAGGTAPALTSGWFGLANLSNRMFQGAGQDDIAIFQIQMPHAWKESGNMELHIHTTPWTAPAGTDTAVWKLVYSWTNINGTFPTIDSVMVKQPLTGQSQWGHYLKELVNWNTLASGKTISSIIYCTLTRLANSNPSDTYTSGITVLYIDCHYEINSLGSRKQLTK